MMKKLSMFFISLLLFTCSSNSQNSLSIDNLSVQSTYEHISIHVNIVGDDNLNSIMSVRYRTTGTNNYLPAAPTMRAHPLLTVDGSPLNMNFHAGSILFLNPNTFYDVEITLTDPEGGNTIVEKTVVTNSFLTPSIAGNTRYVVPGNGGGSGTNSDPFLGIQDAVDTALPGDVIEVAAGIYDPFVITNNGATGNPITIRSTALHQAIIDGDDTTAGMVTIGSFSDSTKYIIVDGFLIRNGRRGIDAQNTQFVSVVNNKVIDVDYGFVNRRENGWEHDQYVHNNEFVGRTSWPQSGIPAERGIDIRGNRNVISYNSISDFADGVSTDGPPYKTSYALDIHHNDINRIVDDLIEIDGVISNARVYSNRCLNGRAGISLAPVFGGPAYVFRNIIINNENSAIKMNRSPSGLFIVNNSMAKSVNGLSSPSGWQNTILKNNALLSTRYCFEEFALVSESIDDWDYNAYYTTRAGTGGEPWYKWDGVRYDDLSDLQNNTLIESDGISITPGDFTSLAVPVDYNNEVLSLDIDCTPMANSDLIDSGLSIENINDHDVTDGMPDIGAVERNADPVVYGHDFSTICNRILPSTMVWEGGLSSAWFRPKNWIPCGIPNEHTVVEIPAGKSHYPVVNTNVKVGNVFILEGGTLHKLNQSAVFEIKD